ncbi:winged helix-turn-helix domain-containing protein [Caballeronia sp. INDeC2]|uniref:ATP-binding protein n=1 Tax=Caballeronia sp. INDeC2 TaxID=2921747 RepID=UPI002027B80E|nr:winged helix-turn-helix domain-containing protein [Caballeronia sp. INDeC2]
MIRIGSLDVDLERRQLSRNGAPVQVGGRAFDVLAVLIEARGELVSKNDLLRQVWPHTVVEENNLHVHLCRLRSLLGESRGLLQMISGRGYRLSRAMPHERSTQAEAEHLVPNNLPSNASEIIGRDDAIIEIIDSLGSGKHVTLIGAGGIGKTRLAVEVGHRALKLFPDGVYLISLASATDYESMLDAASRAMGINPLEGPLSLSRIGEEVGGPRILFVLDNCEQIAGAAGELAESLIGLGDETRVIATSRELLKVANERVYRVEPLHVPARADPEHDTVQCGAVQLFLSRARAIDPLFPSDERSVELIHTVCRRLDGIPLAIELAAARATILGLETLASLLDDRFRVLTGGNRSALPRHQTLRATFDWSYALLDQTERATLRRLSIFSAGFTLPAAIAVVADGSVDEYAIIEAVSGLVEKSLIVGPSGGNAVVYRLLETTRAYALEKLDHNGERRTARLSHARYLATLLGDASDAALSRNSWAWQRNMRELLDDVRAALTWALSSQGDKCIGETLSVRFVRLLFELSSVDECCSWARRSIEAIQNWPDAIGTRSSKRVCMELKATLAAALVYVQGPGNRTNELWCEVLSLAIAFDDRNFEARALWGLWNAAQSAGDAHDALSFAKRFRALEQQACEGDGSKTNGDRLLGYRIVGIASHYAGNQHEAYTALQRFLLRAQGVRSWMPLGRSIDQQVVGNATFARVLWMKGERDEALRLAEQCLTGALAQEQAIVICYVLIEAAIPVALLSDERERAAEAIGTLHEISTRMGLNIPQACSRAFLGYLASLNDINSPQLREFADAMTKLDALGFHSPTAMLIGQYANALGRTGRRDEAITLVARTLERFEETGDMWFASELYRIRGELSISDPLDLNRSSIHGPITDAERYLVKALDIAVSQGASSLQLRAALSLALFRYTEGDYVRARSVLEPACALFPGGREWPDYQEAMRLLQAIQKASVSRSGNPDALHVRSAASYVDAYGLDAQPFAVFGGTNGGELVSDWCLVQDSRGRER